MNSIIQGVVTPFIQLVLLTLSLYLLMNLFSNKAKITMRRIKQYILYSILMFLFAYFILGIRTPIEFLLYIAVLIICFLFEEEHILDKIWKVVLTVAIELSLEIAINYLGGWICYGPLNNWIFYEFGVGIINGVIIGSIVALNKKFKVFKKVKVESLIFSKTEKVLLCILTGCAMFTLIISSIVCEYQDVIDVSPIKTVTWTILTIISTTCLVLGIDRNIAQNYYKRVNELIDTQFKNQVCYYEKIEESNKEIRAIKHDMKNHLISMQSLLHNNQLVELDEYIDDICTTISKTAVLIRTGNTIIDAILNEKYAIAQEKKIDMEIKVGIEEHIDIELIDLCIILSNSIDNAIEACERISDKQKRKINIKCNYQAGYFFYEITNSMKEEAMSNIKSKLLTIKKDKKNHGFGVGNIKQSVKKYGGEVRINTENFTFTLEVEINTKAAITLRA